MVGGEIIAITKRNSVKKPAIWSPPEKPITQRDIACRCGVARSTVSLALHGSPQVEESTRQRILRVAQELGYDPAFQHNARRLAMRQYGKSPVNHVLAVIVDPDEPVRNYHSRLLAGVWHAAYARGYALVVVYFDREFVDTQLQVCLPPVLARGEIDGLIISASLSAEHAGHAIRSCAGSLALRAQPIVSLHTELCDVSRVAADYEQIGYLTAAHLLSLGHRHLVHYVYDNNPVSTRLRLCGAVRAYREYGLNLDNYLHPLVFRRGDMTDPARMATYQSEHATTPEVARRHPLVSYLRVHPEITAVVGINDANAINAWCVLERAGYRIPEEISIVGCDDTDAMPGPRMENRLTTIRVPLEAIGEQAVTRVIAQIENGRLVTEETFLPVELAVRASTVPPGQSIHR